MFNIKIELIKNMIFRYSFALCGFLFENFTDGVRSIKDLLNYERNGL